jgi:K+-sensing histidine kinase KdpD
MASDGSLAARNGTELAALREELAAADERAVILERRAAEAEGAARAHTAADAGAQVLDALEERVATAEARAADAEQRVRALEDEASEHGSSFRHTLGVRAAGRKLAAPSPAPVVEAELGPEPALRAAIARGLRGPLTRAAGLTLSLQGSVGADGKAALRQLSSSIRRLDQLAADLHDVQRIQDGTLPISRRRTDVTALLTTTLEEADQLQEDRLVRLDAERLQATVDPVRLRQVVEGMLEGARERTRAGAAIVVRARATGDGIRISVEDDSRVPASIGPEMSLAARLAELLGTELVAEGPGFHVVLPADGGT